MPLQKKLIAKMMAITLNHPNVLYNMANEGNLGQLYFVDIGSVGLNSTVCLAHFGCGGLTSAGADT